MGVVNAETLSRHHYKLHAEWYVKLDFRCRLQRMVPHKRTAAPDGVPEIQEYDL